MSKTPTRADSFELTRADELRLGMINDLDTIVALTEGMRQNSAFSRTLDAQADTIIQRAKNVQRSYAEMDGHINKYISDEEKKQIAQKDAKVPNKATEQEVAKTAELTDTEKRLAQERARREFTGEKTPVRDPITESLISNDPPTPSQVSGETKTIPAAGTSVIKDTELDQATKDTLAKFKDPEKTT